jgi:hypothetical protein
MDPQNPSAQPAAAVATVVATEAAPLAETAPVVAVTVGAAQSAGELLDNPLLA